MLPNEIDTNQGQIIGTKHIKNFTTIDNLNENQYILAVSDELTGVGLKLSPRALSKTVISPVQGNGLIQDDDGLLYSNSAINKYDETVTYSKGDWVLGSIAGIDKFYKSLQDDNIGNPLTDTDYWQPVSIGGGSGSAGSEIGDIGTALFVDETQGKRRRLNGSIMAINENTQGFVDWLKAVVATTPSLATTEQNWQAEITASVYGQCGKFVIDEENATVRLPKVVNINGLQDLSQAGVRLPESLPNITGYLGMSTNAPDTSGAFFIENTSTASHTNVSGTASGTTWNIGMKASRSSSTYQDNAPVQQEAIQYPYFIQIATGAETQVNIINDIELNNPFTLFDSKYSDHQLYNASWLRSQGQYNPKAIYVKAYEALQVEYNSQVEVGTTVTLPSGTSYTKQGLSVKLSTETYNDYDFVLSTSDETFRLPLKSNLASGKAVVGNGMTLGFTDGYTNFSMCKISSDAGIAGNVGIFGQPVGTPPSGAGLATRYGIGLQTDPTKSGIELSDNNLYLYYYVGETVQNADLIDAGRVMETYATKQFATMAGFPSNRYVNLQLGASGAEYTATANGWFNIHALSKSSNSFIEMYNLSSAIFARGVYGTSGFVFKNAIEVKKGDVCAIYYANIDTPQYFRFIYAEGEN